MNYHPSLTPKEKFEEHLRWAARHATFPLKPKPRRTGPRRLKIGYVSADFYRHSVSSFIEPILAGHDRGRFEIFCYSDVLKPDETTARLQALPVNWRPITGIGQDRAAEIITNDEIDILVDLGGHTKRNRMLLFARKPSPIQATYLGYPNTTGLSQMDYRFTDAYADPAGESDRWHTEKLIRLPHGFLCYHAPPDDLVIATASRAQENRVITFASFNVLSKLTTVAISIWSRILAVVPRSRLILKNSSLFDPGVRQLIETAFAKNGISSDRLDLRPPTETLAEHLAVYRQADIALDTFPYNGTTTTCEALWMGVPVITWTGDTHAARVGSSILNQIGLPELIGASPEDYLRRAVELANDSARLTALRSRMRERMRRSSLLNPAQITADIEAAYHAMAFT
jgi:predicted O-linked N-acetylglucosamine transferase (SPINDLY family)